jgi:hypothetical protein
MLVKEPTRGEDHKFEASLVYIARPRYVAG